VNANMDVSIDERRAVFSIQPLTLPFPNPRGCLIEFLSFKKKRDDHRS